MSVDLHVDIENKGEGAVVRIAGRMDAANTPKLELKLDELIDGGGEKLFLDFQKVDYLSSAGMRLLLSLTKRLSSRGGLVIFAVHEDVMEIIKMAGFERILNICQEEQEALDALL